MKVISIDIGIKNLALAIMEHTKESDEFKFLKWEVVSLCNIIPNCTTCNCKNKAKFTKKDKFFCKKHTKDSDYKIPTINTKTLNKQNTKTLLKLIEENNITLNNNENVDIKKLNKLDLVKLIEDYLENNCFEVIESVNANNVNLIDLGVNLKLELNKIFETIELESIDLIILENQISPIANRMKTIQGMIAQYFINNNNYNIEFMSAANKLKLFVPNEKTSYNERKKLSIIYTSKLLENKNMINDLEYFNKHSKKDDLADCFLQGIYYLVNMNKLALN